MTSRRRAAKVAALIAYIIVILVATPQAQQQVAFSGAPGAVTAGPTATLNDATAVDLLVGRSTILNVGGTIARVSLTVPDIADAMVTAPTQLLIHGKTPGTISLFVWDRAGGIKTYEVSVRRDLTPLIEQMKQLFPGEPVTVVGSGKDVVISGTVSSKYVIDKAADVAAGYVEKKENVVNLLKQQEGVASNQVMLRVRFAEVSRSAMQELGASFILDRFKSDAWDVRTSTQQFSAPEFDSSKPGQLNFSDFLNLFVFNSKEGIGTVVKALQGKGLFQSLAEPNLIALNGKEASFLAGGEYPYPVVQPGGSGGAAVTIMFKEFGVRLHFTPTVLGGDLINLKVRPEVSSLDFSNAITLEGFRVPALSTRRTETEVELQDGQTFAIAGLMNNTLNSTMQKIPGIGDIPVLGYLFRSRAYQKNQTELVVMITPHIIRRGSTGASAGLPSIVEPFMGAPNKTLPAPAPYVGSPQYPATEKARPAGGQGPVAPQPAAVAPASAPAALVAPAPSNVSAAVPAPAAAKPLKTNPVTVAVEPAAKTPVPAPKKVEAPKAEPKVDAKEVARLRDAQKRAEEQQKAAEKKAADEKAIADKKAADEKAAADKKEAEEKAVADKKAAEEKARQDKLDAERARREAEVAKKNAELEHKRQADLKKHEKTISEAAARLKQAQAAYQAEMDKKKGVQ
jgi:pilus assembly protein CpaC